MIHILLKYLQQKAINYAIISGYENLFNNKLNIGDIDILFKKQDFLNIESILKDFCLLEGFKIVQIYHQEVYAKNIFIFNPKTTELLNLDIYGKLHRKQTCFFSETEIFENLSFYKGINILTTHQEFLHYLIKKIDKNDITDSVFNYLYRLFFKEKTRCKSIIKKSFKNMSMIIIEAFETNNKKKLVEHIRVLKKDIIANPQLSIIYKIKNKLRILKRIIKPTGMSICFLGPDGSGKSTIINGLLKKTLPYRKTAYFHLKPYKANNNKSSATINPHEYKPYTKLKSYTKLLFFIYQYNWGWIKNIWLLKLKSTLVIFDRYYDDLIVDHKRYRYGGSVKIAKLVRAFIPQPEHYFILIADAKIIYSRKQEVLFSELQSQIEKYKALTDNKQYHLVDVNKLPEDIVTEVYTILMKKMNERY